MLEYLTEAALFQLDALFFLARSDPSFTFGLARKAQLVQRRLLKLQQIERTGRDKTPLMPEK